jgi:hypothetical protein
VSAFLSGPAAERVITRPRLLYARFPFVALPSAGRPISVQWITPKGPLERLPRPRIRNVAGVVRAGGGARLAPGRYTCILRVGGKVVDRRSVTVRPG